MYHIIKQNAIYSQRKQGLQKAVSRLPHQILSKKGDGTLTIHESYQAYAPNGQDLEIYPANTLAQISVTRDPEYMELEKQFKLLSQNVQRLQTDAETYRDGVAGMCRP